MTTAKKKTGPTPKAPQNDPAARTGARAARRRAARANGAGEAVRVLRDGEIPGVTVIDGDSPPQDDIIYLDQEDCALLASLAMGTQGAQILTKALLKGMGKDLSEGRHLAILAAALVPDRPGLDPTKEVQHSGKPDG